MNTTGDQPLWANEEFYAGDPADYFQRRLNLLLLAAAGPDRVDELLGQGVSYEGLVSVVLDRSSEASDANQLAYLITESQSILHHASEALLRLFLAHAGSPDCPWLELATIATPAQFKTHAAELAKPRWAPGLEAALGPVFLGSEDGDHPEWPAAREAAGTLIRLLAAGLIREAHLYNSIKHGLGVMPSDASFGILFDEQGPAFGSQGPSAAYIERKHEGSERTWQVTRRWVSIRRSIWLASLAARQIDALWAIARRDYLGHEVTGVHCVTSEAIEVAVSGDFADRQHIQTWSRTLLVEAIPDRKRKGR